MQPHRNHFAPFGKSVWLPLLACATLGAFGAHSAARADDTQEKKEIKVIVTDDDNAVSKPDESKLSDEDRKKLHAELDALTKERSKLDEKIRSLRGKLGERGRAIAIVNGKRIDLSSDALPRIETLGKDGNKQFKLFFKDSDGKSSDILVPHIETFGGDGDKRIELRLRNDLNDKLEVLQDLSPEQRKQMEKGLIEADIQLKRTLEKSPKLMDERTIILRDDKAPLAKGQIRILRSDSDSRIRELEKRIEALEKRLKMKMKAEKKSDDNIELEMF